jgi:DNA-binding MarR family transcriptional regulator
VSNDTVAHAGAPATDLLPGELSAWGGFLRTHAQLTRVLDAELTETHGLPLSSYEVLLRLARAPEGHLRMSELAESVLLSPSGLTRLADRLERAGLIVRKECSTDQRGLLAVITDEGRRLLRQAARTHIAGVRERFLRHLTPEEQRSLGEIWKRLTADRA